MDFTSDHYMLEQLIYRDSTGDCPKLAGVVASQLKPKQFPVDPMDIPAIRGLYQP